MSRNARRVAAASVLILLLAASAFGAEGTILRRAYKAGEKYLAVAGSEQDITRIAPDGTTAKIRQTQRTEMLLEVLSVAPGGAAETRVTYKRMAMSVDSPTVKFDYDSADPVKSAVDNPFLTITKVLVGKTVTATVSDRGDVTAVAGVEPITAEVLAKIPEGPNREAAKQELGKSLNTDSLKQALAIFGIPIPAEPKDVAQTWNWDQSVSLGHFADMAIHTVCKVEAATEKSVEVSMNATMEITRVSPGFTVTIDPASRNVGKTTFDRANAAITSGSSQSSLSMTVVSQGQKVTSKTVGTSTVSVTKQ